MMFSSESKMRQEGLERMQSYLKKSIENPSSDIFRKNMIEAQGLYHGDVEHHFDEVGLEKLRKRGQCPIVVNIIAGLIDNLSGYEIQHRRRAAIASMSGNSKDEECAEGLRKYYYNHQELQRINFKSSIIYRSMLINGIAWSYQYNKDGTIHYDVVNPINMHPDYDDLSENFINSKFLGRSIYMHRDKVISYWPKAAHHLDLSDNYYLSGPGSWSSELEDRRSNMVGLNGNSNSTSGDIILVYEMQYRKPEKAYCSYDKENRYFETFSEEDAEKISRSSKEIEEIKAERIIRGLFIGDCLLEYAPLNPDIPNRKDFSYIPVVSKKNFSNNTPYGVVQNMKHLQKDLNARLTKALYNFGSSRVKIQGPLPPGMNVENIRTEMQKSDSVLIMPNGTAIDVQSNAALGRDHLDIIDKYIELAQRTVGVHDEMLGIQTNATSAIAQQERVVNSARNNVYGLDNYMYMKEREAYLWLDLLQSTDQKNILVQTVSEEEEKEIWLNLHRVCDVSGKEIVINNIQNISVSIYIEEVPNYQTIAEERSAMFREIFNQPQAPILFSSPELLSLYSNKISKTQAQKASEEYMKAQSSLSQGGAPAPGQPSGLSNPSGPQQYLPPIS